MTISIQHKTFAEQIEILEARNMTFSDKKRAEKTLAFVSYYKIKEMAKPFSVFIADEKT